MIAFMVLLAMTNRVAELQGKICSLQLQEQNIQNEIHAAKMKEPYRQRTDQNFRNPRTFRRVHLNTSSIIQT